jgi:hypothetical protein
MTTFDRYASSAVALLQDPATGHDTRRAILAEMVDLLDREDRRGYVDGKCSVCGTETVGYTMEYGDGVTRRFCGLDCQDQAPAVRPIAAVEITYDGGNTAYLYVWDEPTRDRYSGLYGGDIQTLWPTPGGYYELGQVTSVERY